MEGQVSEIELSDSQVPVVPRMGLTEYYRSCIERIEKLPGEQFTQLKFNQETNRNGSGQRREVLVEVRWLQRNRRHSWDGEEAMAVQVSTHVPPFCCDWRS